MWQLLFPTNKASKALREDCVKLAVVEVRSSKLSLFSAWLLIQQITR